MSKFLPLKMAFKSPWFWCILGGYTLRIIFMPVTGQHDVMFVPWMTHFINLGHFNLYSYLYERFGDVVMRSPAVWAPYPYGFYLFTSGWLELLEKLRLIDLKGWDLIWGVQHPARLVFLFKAAYLPFDLSIGYLLYRTAGRLGLTLWAWSPAAIYTPFLMGQNDVYATAFAVAGIYTAAKSIQVSPLDPPVVASLFPNKWALLSSVFLGIGASFKVYPLLLLPLLVLVLEKEWRHRLMLLFAGFAVFGIAALPFITTPTFINGVLMNPEGVRVFKEVQLFGISVSPFLIGYAILGLALLLWNRETNPPHLAWNIGLLTLALLFLWIPIPFYWSIWITPFLIGAMAKAPKLLWGWFIFQFAFVLTLFAQHRELGVALPLHLSDTFNVPNLPTVLALDHPMLSRLFAAIVRPASNAFWVVSLLLMIWYALGSVINKEQQPIVPRERMIRWMSGIPVTVLILGLMGNLYLSQNLVSTNNLNTWQGQTLSTSETAVQTLDPPNTDMTGMRLRLIDATPSAVLRLCLYGNGDMSQPALICQSKNTDEQVENRVIYFEFGRSLSLKPGETLTAKIDVETPDAKVTLPYTLVDSGDSLQLNDEILNGKLDISMLTSFDGTEAFNDLMVKGILKDGWLLLLIIIAEILVMGFIGRIVVSNSEGIQAG